LPRDDLMLATGGVFTGGVVWYGWERVWIWRRLALLPTPSTSAAGSSG
jgi:hypothetical protein